MTATGPARKERTRDADVAATAASGRSGSPRLSVAPDPRTARVEAARAEWNARLVDLGGPNTLLWYRDHPAVTLDLTRAHLGARSALLGGSPTLLSELVREPAVLEDARRRAASISATSRAVLEEHGVRTCFLGIGMARWTVRQGSGSAAPLEAAAPVLLRSCTIRPVDPVHSDWLLTPGDELELNPVLASYMASAHQIELDTGRLEELATSGSTVDAYPTYAALAEACAPVPDLSVSPTVVAATFPYFKAALVADLSAQAQRLARSDVIATLAGEPGLLPGGDGPPSPRDGSAGGADLLVLDSDAVQREVVDAVRGGGDLVVHGPPGTGKTQTVANLVAALAADGQRVLLVSSRRGAIDAVRTRLAAVGLDDLVLDLPAGGHRRRAVVRELVAGLDRLVADRDDDPGAVARTITRRADAVARLDEHVAALHERRAPWNVTLHDVQEAVSGFAATDNPPRTRVRLRDGVLRRLDPTALAAAVRTMTSLAAIARWDEDAADPWYGARVATADEAEDARERVERLAGGALEDAERTLREVFRGILLPQHPTVLDWGRVLRTVGEVRDTLEVFRPDVFDIPLRGLVEATAPAGGRRAGGSDVTTLDRWRLRRQARGLLRPGRPPADLHAALASAQEQRDAWRELAGSGGRPEIPVELDRARAAHEALLEDLTWLDARLPATGDEGEERTPLVALDLATLRERLDGLAGSLGRLDAVPAERAALDTLDENGLRPLADDLRARGVPADDVRSEVEWAWWCSLAEEIGRQDLRVSEHDGPALTEDLAELSRCEAAVLAGNPARVSAAVARRVREVRRRHPQQETLLRAEAVRVRPVPLPDLVAAAPDLLTAVRPCWAMSPLDVPSVLPPGETFDVVVVEEASVVAVAEVVPALTRAHRVVVVGDEQQAPPSAFTVGAPEALPDVEDGPMPSVLDLLAPVLPAARLAWHHRSRDGRLVDFVDRHVYRGSLVTFPDVDRGPVVHQQLVDGHGFVTAGDAAVETTSAEVDRVLDLVLDHARHRADRSLMVVALSPTHAERVEEAVRRALPGLDDAARAFFDDDRPEPFVVRPLDRAQGEERDDVIVTVGFGRTPHGRVIHRFGVLGGPAGHRHLTVALTRARASTTVVSTISADHLDPDRLRARGPQLLRDLLEEVAHGGAGAPARRAGPTRSVVVADLARRLRAHGLVVHEDVGEGRDPIDLAVEDPTRPGHLLLAVEADGPRYAAVTDARDRDRLRAEVLGRRGWRHLRVWTTDLFRDPARDVSRILEAVGVREAPGD